VLVSDRLEGELERAYALGRANRTTIELARRHCLDMAFTPFEGGGRGLAEQFSGLPIDTRRVSCPVARGDMAGMNLNWLASDFYDRHCVGCRRRRPTGEVPNLASVMEARKAEAAAAAEAERQATMRQHHEWEQRAERRRAAAVGADPAMASALGDIAVTDHEPGRPSDPAAVRDALGRLTALADRAPGTFTSAVVDLAVQMAEHAGVTSLLGPLRHLARHRADVRPVVLSAALSTLRADPMVEAGRCVADLSGLLDSASLDRAAIWSLVVLAGEPEDDLPIRRPAGSAARDPSGLRAAAEAAPQAVATVLRDMLPPPARRPSLMLLPGTGGQTEDDPAGEFGRICAANAVRALASTHPAVAAQLTETLIISLGVGYGGDLFDDRPAVSVQRALSAMLVLGIGDVITQLERAGKAADSETSERLFGVIQQAGRLLDPHDRWREPGGAQPDGARRRELFDQLISMCLARAAGDWGDDTRYAAADLASDLAGMEPMWASGHVNTFLGLFVTTIGQLGTTPVSPLIAAGGPSSGERALEAFTRQNTITATARELLSAVENAAAAGPAVVCHTVTALIAEERDTGRGIEVAWRLLPLLGRIGRRHGAEPGVLAAILPVLHTYLVDSQAALRAAALEAWAEAGTHHELPSSVADLLPALLGDRYVVVVRAVLQAARTFTWSEPDRLRLFLYAYSVCAGADADGRGEPLTDAIATLDALAGDDADLLSHAEALILRRAADLDRYALRDVLRRDWSPQAAHSAEMAALRLRQARDPAINGQFNHRGDEQLCALLACGPGLAEVPAADLVTAAAELGPGRLAGCAEFAEVAWRAGRPADAAAIMRAVARTIPDQPAFDSHRAITQLLIDAADFDTAASCGADVREAASRLTAAVTAADTAGELGTDLARQARVRAAARFLLTGHEPPTGLTADQAEAGGDPADPADAFRRRAGCLAAAGKELESLSDRATVTGVYIRAFAGLCGVAGHLLRYAAAELDADISRANAHKTAAQRRAILLDAELARQFPDGDPLAGGLRNALTTAGQVSGDTVAPVLASWAALPLPILMVRGPRRLDRPLVGRAQEPGREARPVAVVLASVDGQLITGPQVLRPGTVYELGLEVRPGPWPDWADRLEAELISHLTAQEAHSPSFSWRRPPAAASGAGEALTGNGTLIVRFGLPAGRPAPPFLVTLRWRGTRDGKPVTEALDVAGHRELRLRPFDASRDFLTEFPVFDERLLALYERLHGAGYDEGQLQAFCRLFTAICRAGLKIMWDPRYKRGAAVREREFHDDLYTRLLGEPELGARLERGSRLGLGFLDVRHDGITAELKVERRTPVTQETAPKYMGQPTQYAAADGARLSILSVLDMSRKTSPVGVPENYVFTLEPALHGLTNPEAPSLVAMIVINGNNPRPSSWSRHKTALQPGTGSAS
jgi:hypothetical protein